MISSAKSRLAGTVAFCLLAGIPMTAQATEGYFALAYGTAQRGVAGAGVAYSQDAMSGSLNPAAVASVGRELNFGLEAFSPKRQYTATGTLMVAPGTVKSGHNVFPVPNFAYNMPLANGAVLNFAAYGNGGMNTSYPAVANPNCTSPPYPSTTGVFCAGKAGVDLTQLFVSVTYAKKEGNLSWGVAPTLAMQSFAARGIMSFASNSSDPANLSSGKHDMSYGVGLRAGLQYEVSPQVTLGLSGQTKFNMTKFDKYAGLFANGGEFDIPASVTAGVAVKVQPNVTVMLDYQKIFYSDIPAVGNPSTLLGSVSLGAAGGPGFGWGDVDVIRLAAEWQQSDDMTWRVGYAHSSNPVRSIDAMFNIFAPGVVEDHFSIGGSKKLNDRDRLDFSASYVLSNSVTGPELMPGSTGSIELKMHQVSAAIGWTRKF